MTNLQISLVIPMYNAARHLAACLESVAGQTLREFECLCIDDGSTDASAAIAQAFAARDPRFKLIQQANAGCSAARNRGIRAAAAPHLAFLDADDLLHPQAFEIALRLIEHNRADMASFQMLRVPDDFSLSAPERYAPEALSVRLNEAPFQSFFASREESASACPRLYRKASVEGVFFPEGIHFAEDLAFTAMAMHRIRRIAAVSLPLLFYRDNPHSATNREVTEREVRSYVQAAQVMDAYFKAQTLAPRDARNVAVLITTMVYKTCVLPLLRDPRLAGKTELRATVRRLVAELADTRVLSPRRLSLRKRWICQSFLKGRFRLAQRLERLVARKRKKAVS